jgi:hypothetical protein
LGIGQVISSIENLIYMASNISESLAVYPALVNEHEKVTDKHGGLDHLKDRIKIKPHLCEANKICWITDRTPHEALPVKNNVHRQFFKLVVFAT